MYIQFSTLNYLCTLLKNNLRRDNPGTIPDQVVIKFKVPSFQLFPTFLIPVQDSARQTPIKNADISCVADGLLQCEDLYLFISRMKSMQRFCLTSGDTLVCSPRSFIMRKSARASSLRPLFTRITN